MKHAELRSIVHNVADSLASGCSALTGFYELDIFDEAARSAGGVLKVDLLKGQVLDGQASASTRQAVSAAASILPLLSSKLVGGMDEITEARANFWSDEREPKVLVTVTDCRGRSSSTEYAGLPAKRTQVLDALGRRRPKTSLG